MKTCRHYRFQVPREIADELRDADDEPCAVCDALPHRLGLMQPLVQEPERAWISASRVRSDWSEPDPGLAAAWWAIRKLFRRFQPAPASHS